MSNILLFDFNNLAHRCIHLPQLRMDTPNPGYGLLTYMLFNHIYDFALNLSAETGEQTEVVLALDSITGYWRTELYPPYKADRAARRAEDGIDWPAAYAEINRLLAAIEQHIPWKVLRVDKCEADDIIYKLSQLDAQVYIHSGDSDYCQLVADNVNLYSPNSQQYVEFPGAFRIAAGEVYCETPEDYLKYAILTGQGGKDNVYNVKTPTDWDASAGKRKPGFGVKAAEKCITAACGMETWLEQNGLLENYRRNKTLIDMRELPEHYGDAITEAYNSYPLPVLDVRGFLANYDWPSLSTEESINTLEYGLSAMSDPAVTFTEHGEEITSSFEPLAF